jgi:hypothetical protein
MDYRIIAASVQKLLAPFLRKGHSIASISKSIVQVNDDALTRLWTIIKPVFTEAFEEDGGLSIEINDDETVKYVLKRKLRKDEALSQQLASLIETIEEDSLGSKSFISGSKNVIQDSLISVGRDVHVGDSRGIDTSDLNAFLDKAMKSIKGIGNK